VVFRSPLIVLSAWAGPQFRLTGDGAGAGLIVLFVGVRLRARPSAHVWPSL
jgi:hypothetical protein